MRIERHVFGSFNGYTTLARTPGISIEDAKTLEGSSYAFGQTQDRRYLKSLKGTPAYFTRSLRGGRRGLTRVLEGTPDDNGRPTLCMVTAVVSQREWDNELAGDVNLLLSDSAVWQWKPNTSLEPIDKPAPAPELSISRAAGTRVAELMSQLERAMASGHGVVVSASEFGEDVLRAVEMLTPPAVRAQFTSANRSLSSRLAVTMNCIAPEAPDQKLTYRLGSDTTPSPFAQFLLSSGLSSGRLPVAEVITYRTFGRIARSASVDATVAPPPPPPPVGEENSKLVAIAAGLLIAIIFFGGGFWSGRRTSLKAAVAVIPTPTALSPRPSSQPSAVSATKQVVSATTQPTAPITDPKKQPAAKETASTIEKGVSKSKPAASAPVDPSSGDGLNAALVEKQLESAKKNAETEESPEFQEVQAQMVSDALQQLKSGRDFKKDHLRVEYISQVLGMKRGTASDPIFQKATEMCEKYVKMFKAYTAFEHSVNELQQKREPSAEDISKLNGDEKTLKDAMKQLKSALDVPAFEYHEVSHLQKDADDLRSRLSEPSTTQKSR